MVLFRHTWLVAVLVLTACYEPFPPWGVPCQMDEVNSCPTVMF